MRGASLDVEGCWRWIVSSDSLAKKLSASLTQGAEEHTAFSTATTGDEVLATSPEACSTFRFFACRVDFSQNGLGRHHDPS